MDKLKPKVVILESVERAAIGRISKQINWDLTLDAGNVVSKLKKQSKDNSPNPSFINTLNYNALIYTILYNYDDNAFFSKVYISEISKKLFSSQKQTQLLFYYADLQNIKSSNKESITLLNDNLNNSTFAHRFQ